MIAKKLMITFLGILISLTVYYNVVVHSDLKEPFLGLSGIAAVSLPQKLNKGEPCNACSSHIPTFTVPGTYQPNLSPRMLSEPYSGQIRYNAAPQRFMGVPSNPLGYADSVGYKRPTVRENYSSNTLSAELDAAQTPLPTQSMDAVVQNCTMDRFMTAILKSKSWGPGDPIRGDIPIMPTITTVPGSGPGWFTTTQQYKPVTALRTGALQAMSGVTPPIASFVQTLSEGTMNTNSGMAQPILPNTSVGRALQMGVGTTLHGQNQMPTNTIAATQF